MLKKIDKTAFMGHGPIQTLYPGYTISGSDSGIGSIGRIDHAYVRGKQHIAMHPHVNDEILSYFRAGKVEHIDSEGYKDTITSTRLMLMKAGKLFYHEELIDGQSEPFEGLQIFIRPGAKNLKPEVTFQNLGQRDSENTWRLLASPTSQTTLRFSSQSWLYDNNVSAGTITELPEMPDNDLTALLYIYQGSVQVNGHIDLEKNEALIVVKEVISIKTGTGAEMVLFYTAEHGSIFKDGMFSGNKASFKD
ncbi:pirin family protein [Dyadobacter sp. UP-52]|uniref:Pirin family protein n=2 Tax=Dyadobacter subterraneus TaxID=2773304 RepID=A0ABR9WF43_9BACT|nr:pirin family protein [Dyadobacter subterraneus]